jgi:hypothetical protein
MAPRAPALSPHLAALLAATLVATGARAQESPPPTVDGTVVLRIAGPDDPALRDSVRELLARLHLALAGAAADADGGAAKPAVARVEIDLSSPSDAVLLVSDGKGEVRFRRTVPRDASAAIVREEIAHAVQSAVESEVLAARERPAPAPPPASPPAGTPPPPLAPPPNESAKEQPAPLARGTPFGLELTTLAGAGPIADGSGPVARVGLGAIASATRTALRPSLGVSVLYAVPFDSDTAEVTSHTSLLSARGLAAIELFRGRWLAANLGVGAGFDTMTVTPRSPNLPSSNLYPTTTRTDAILSAMATAHAALFPGVVFLVSAGADVDLASRRYVLAQGSAETDVLAPWRVRPMVLAGFGFTAFGDGHFGGGGVR